MKISELLSKATVHPVPKGRNIGAIGWADGYILVQFKGKPSIWIYGPNIAEVERDKVLRVPYPDRQFTAAIKNKYQAFKAT